MPARNSRSSTSSPQKRSTSRDAKNKSSLVYLKCVAQNYAWGKPASESYVASMLHVDTTQDNYQKRYAELWVGTHPSGPSRIMDKATSSAASSESELLSQYLEDPLIAKKYFSPLHRQFIESRTLFNDRVPYLLKILSISTALSIQAHPNKRLAEELHRKLPDKYKDPNHKPELIVSLSPKFEAMCGFRRAMVVLYYIASTPALADVIDLPTIAKTAFTSSQSTLQMALSKKPRDQWSFQTFEQVVRNVMPPVGSAEEKALLRSIMQRIYEVNADEMRAALEKHITLLQSECAQRKAAASSTEKGSPNTRPNSSRWGKRPSVDAEEVDSARAVADEVFLRVYDQYPGDVGCWMVYVLNYVVLRKNDALVLGDSEPHAYISGDGVEIMACSDNVVRAGLTPKWKDVETLVSMLTYETGSLRNAKQLAGDRHATKTVQGWELQRYAPPEHKFRDFSLFRASFTAPKARKSNVNIAPSSSGSAPARHGFLKLFGGSSKPKFAAASITIPTIGLGFCVEGSGYVNGSPVKKGDCFTVPYGEVRFTQEDDSMTNVCTIFVASTNTLPHGRSKL